MSLLLLPVRSSLGTKYLMALTGLVLILFVLGHMAGNLLIFLGPDAINSYAQALKERPTLLWGARIFLLVVFVLHVVLGIRLALWNQSARPTPYVKEDTVRASWASRHMVLTGILLLVFVIYHLAHFTVGVVHKAHVDGKTIGYLELKDPLYEPEPGKHRHDVYRMVIAGFQNPVISITYLFFQLALWMHLWHGVSSWFQSMGINHSKYNRAMRLSGPIVATVVLIGNSSMPLCIWLGVIR
jgi:succinate dehydrogenase / fumarate reductase cytochrome b subunit